MPFGSKQTHEMHGESGEAIYTLRRPGTEMGIVMGRIIRSLRVKTEGRTETEIEQDINERITEEQEFQSSVRMVEACIAGPVKLTEYGQEIMRKATGLELTEVQIVRKPSKPGEFLVTDIPSQDFFQIVAWCQAGCPDIPVPTLEGEETTVEAVENFSIEQGRSAEPDSDGENNRSADVEAVGIST